MGSLGRPRHRLEDITVAHGSRVCLDSSGLGYSPVKSSCEYGNEPSGSVKGREFPE
jgi:hypothetical protein